MESDFYEENKIREKEQPQKKENSAILIGLNNIGATCYMNATLQCLSNTEQLTNYFLNNYIYKKKDDTKKISNQYYKLLKKLWDSNRQQNYYSPTKFKEILSKENTLFSGKNANDSKDLLNFLIERLHSELNCTQEIEGGKKPKIIDQLNEEEVKLNYFNDFINNYRSIISDLFYFTIETKSQCCGCNKIKYNFQINTFVEFPLEQVNKFCYENGKINSLVNIDGSNPDVNLIDCFEYYQKIDKLTGENVMYCNSCKNTFEAFYGTFLYILPQILIINLNRGKNAIYKCNVNFPEELDLTPYVFFKECNTQFQLYAVICHFGPSSNSGHFVAYCRNRMDHKWYLYNDSIVSLCKEPHEYNKGMPYILFYQSKTKPDDATINKSSRRKNGAENFFNMMNENNDNNMLMNQNNINNNMMNRNNINNNMINQNNNINYNNSNINQNILNFNVNPNNINNNIYNSYNIMLQNNNNICQNNINYSINYNYYNNNF